MVGGSIALSQLATHLSLYFSDADLGTLWVASIIAVLVPAIAATSCTWVLLKILRELRNAYEHAEHLANTDSLTGVFSRRRFTELALDSITHNTQSGRPTSLLLLDADDFKKINDTHGHAAGDMVLQALANSIQTCMSPNDVIARWGGEEFVILLAGTGTKKALSIAEQIRQSVALKRIVANGCELQLTVSAGLVTHHPRSQASLDMMISHADAAMYSAKTLGKNRVEVWSDSKTGDGASKSWLPTREAALELD